jgi:UDP-N-acetylglucosamine--N-acetylmuramyl-(pentapeptide) pyrophosphoryl-undecaprenol N-acetylglucosamine transferase
MSAEARPIVVTAGGSGGHLFPAAACAREMMRRGRRVVLVCDRRGARFAPDDVERRLIRAGSPSGPLPARLRGLWWLGVGFAESLLLLRRLRPAAVASFGSYASAPAALAAELAGVPVLVHEQNALLGRANRLVARRAARVALTFARTARVEGVVPPERRVVTGNPLRPEVAALAGTPYAPPAADGPLSVLVMGGSQGARVFSDLLPAALPLLPQGVRRRLRLVQQCRAEDLERVRAAYGAAGIEAELSTFFADAPARMAAAHLIVCRSGATTVAELTALGRPALLAPLPQATEGDQRANAEVLAGAGAAVLLEDADLTPEGFARRLGAALGDPARLAGMAAAAATLARPGAAEALADAVQAMIKGRTATVAGAAAVGDVR